MSSPPLSFWRAARHELSVAWSRLQIRRANMPSGLGDAVWTLHGLVRTLKPSVCVEIGSAHGLSTCVIALALKQNLHGRLWAVDPHLPNAWSDDQAGDTWSDLARNLRRARVSSYVEVVRLKSAEAGPHLPSAIDFAFIDGDHSYEGVRTDWSLLAPRMTPGGILALHDTLWDRKAGDPEYRKWRRPDMGVPRFMEELRNAGYPIITLEQNWGLSLVHARPGGWSFV
ncbi:MAG: class I SAM-dependent methyltransferase [Opitutaceae bacterium]